MWIRSQDKTKIIDSKGVYVVNSMIRCEIEDTSVFMGMFSSVEKALKVLDMIEKHLNLESKIVEQSMNEYYISSLHVKVFQIPEDKDVI